MGCTFLTLLFTTERLFNTSKLRSLSFEFTALRISNSDRTLSEQCLIYGKMIKVEALDHLSSRIWSSRKNDHGVYECKFDRFANQFTQIQFGSMIKLYSSVGSMRIIVQFTGSVDWIRHHWLVNSQNWSINCNPTDIYCHRHRLDHASISSGCGKLSVDGRYGCLSDCKLAWWTHESIRSLDHFSG